MLIRRLSALKHLDLESDASKVLVNSEHLGLEQSVIIELVSANE
jgi:hypothetical protein